MPNRKRPITMRLAVTEEEKKHIEEKMKTLGTHNFGAYARKMLIDGYIKKVDYSVQRKLTYPSNLSVSCPLAKNMRKYKRAQ